MRPDFVVADPRSLVVLLGASGVVLVVARRSGSLVWCALVGMGVYALLGMVV